MAKVPFYARRFVCGTELGEATACAKSLNEKGVEASLDLLGENITEDSAAKACAQEYITLLAAIQAKGLKAHVSLKLTMLGLDISQSLCQELLSQVLAQADAVGSRVALDMEGSAYTERTLAMYEWACKQFRSPEVVLQAYLKRTPEDVQRVMKANGRFRLCKGAYKESPQVAFQNMKEIREQYLKIAEACLVESKHICLATHDDEVMKPLQAFIGANKISKEKYEFQMLYGMREKTWYETSSQGYPMTVYVPYGAHWQAYYSRRLAERKENVFFVLKNLFRD